MKIERATLLNDHANDAHRHGRDNDAPPVSRAEQSTDVAEASSVTISPAARSSFERELATTSHFGSNN